MKSLDNVGVVFVNSVVGRGVLNGVINLSFSTFNFTPSPDGSQVEVDPAISCRLRMDKICAIQLRDVMNELLSAIEKVETDAAMGIDSSKAEGLIPKQGREKIN
jgi:hypothetical protein